MCVAPARSQLGGHRRAGRRQAAAAAERRVAAHAARRLPAAGPHAAARRAALRGARCGACATPQGSCWRAPWREPAAKRLVATAATFRAWVLRHCAARQQGNRQSLLQVVCGQGAARGGVHPPGPAQGAARRAWPGRPRRRPAPRCCRSRAPRCGARPGPLFCVPAVRRARPALGSARVESRSTTQARYAVSSGVLLGVARSFSACTWAKGRPCCGTCSGGPAWRRPPSCCWTRWMPWQVRPASCPQSTPERKARAHSAGPVDLRYAEVGAARVCAACDRGLPQRGEARAARVAAAAAARLACGC